MKKIVLLTAVILLVAAVIACAGCTTYSYQTTTTTDSNGNTVTTGYETVNGETKIINEVKDIPSIVGDWYFKFLNSDNYQVLTVDANGNAKLVAYEPVSGGAPKVYGQLSGTVVQNADGSFTAKGLDVNGDIILFISADGKALRSQNDGYWFKDPSEAGITINKDAAVKDFVNPVAGKWYYVQQGTQFYQVLTVEENGNAKIVLYEVVPQGENKIADEKTGTITPNGDGTYTAKGLDSGGDLSFFAAADGTTLTVMNGAVWYKNPSDAGLTLDKEAKRDAVREAVVKDAADPAVGDWFEYVEGQQGYKYLCISAGGMATLYGIEIIDGGKNNKIIDQLNGAIVKNADGTYTVSGLSSSGDIVMTLAADGSKITTQGGVAYYKNPADIGLYNPAA